MPKYISIEKRNDIIFHKQNNKTNKEIATYFRVCTKTVQRIWSEYEKTGKSEPKVSNCGRKSVITEEQKNKIIEQIELTPDITLNELIDKFSLKISESGLSRYLKRLKYTFKKKVHIQPSKIEKML